MPISDSHFKNPDEIIDWHKSAFPPSYQEYLAIKERIKVAKFSGAIQLLRNLESNKKVTDFLSFLTEINLANLFLAKSVKDLCYEPKHIRGADFSFEDIAFSVKNLHPKDYERKEQEKIDDLRAKGGGKESLTHKNFSDIFLKVEPTGMGTYSWERTETGHSGFLDSDIAEMSVPLKYMGEFENTEIKGRKKVLFFFIQSDGFPHYYIADIAFWYFGMRDEKYKPIFDGDESWYWKLFKNKAKKDNIDSIIFMYAPNTLLSWPSGCLTQVVDGKARLIILSREKDFHNKLKTLFS